MPYRWRSPAVWAGTSHGGQASRREWSRSGTVRFHYAKVLRSSLASRSNTARSSEVEDTDSRWIAPTADGSTWLCDDAQPG